MANPPQAEWSKHYEDWLHFLRGCISAVDAGKQIPLGPSPALLSPPAAGKTEGKPAKVVICPPHPDDEALSGALAQRLRQDSGAEVTSVAVTLGSNVAERPRRLHEVEAACRALGFKLIVLRTPHGLDKVTQENRTKEPGAWAEKVSLLREVFDQEQPDLVLAPHAQDFNTSHVGTHWLAVDALGQHLEHSGRGLVLLAETEIWHQIEKPNMMLGLTPEFVAAQLVGIVEHGDEMRRNPYHLLHGCRLMDNVRRGSEVVGGQGAAARNYVFAEIYNVVMIKGRERVEPLKECIVDPDAKVSLPWLKSQFWPSGV